MNSRADAGRAARVAAAGLCCWLFGWCAGLQAADLPPGGAITVRRLPVPEDELERVLSPAVRPADWPADGWLPMDRQEFERLLQAGPAAAARPPAVWLKHAEYTAVFSQHMLLGGEFRAAVEHRGRASQLLPLDPLNLAVSDLSWTAGEALAGLSPQGTALLLVEPGRGELRGRWTLSGRRLPHSVEFDVRIPAAAASRVRLRTPANCRAASSVGVISGPVAAEPAGWVWWEVDLGSQTQMLLRIIQTDGSSPPPPLVLSTEEVSHVARIEGLQCRASFELDVLEAPIDRVQFIVPAEVEVLSVTYGTETALEWTETRRDAVRRIEAVLPAGVIGRSQPIRIEGYAPLELARTWELPRIRLVGGVPVSNRVNLRIDQPLVLQSVETRGARQSAVVFDAGRGETLTFQEFAPDSRVAVSVDFPRTLTTARIVSHLAINPETWEARSEITWRARTGSTFVTHVTIPDGWNVADVETASGGAAATNPRGISRWSLTPTADGWQDLRIEFLRAITAEAPQTVTVSAYQAARSEAATLRLPAVAAGVYESACLIAVSHTPDFSVLAEANPALESIQADALPESFRESALAAAIAQEPSPRRLWLLTEQPELGMGVRVVAGMPRLAAQARVSVELLGEWVEEKFDIRCRPARDPLDAVYVHLSRPGPPIEWVLSGGESTPLAAERLPPAEIVSLLRTSKGIAPESSPRSVPASAPAGEVWRIVLPTATREEFRLYGKRTRTLNDAGLLALAFVPGAETFTGSVQFSTHLSASRQVEARGLEPIQEASSDPAAPRLPVRTWKYGAFTPDLALRVEPAADRVSAGLVAFLELHSTIFAERGRDDLHRARFVFDAPPPDGLFRFRLEPPATLIEFLADGRPVPVQLLNGGETAATLPDQSVRRIEIRYRVPGAGGWLRQRLHIPLPQTPATIARFQWEAALAPHRRATAAPEGVLFDEADPGLSVLERFFGPLGRARGFGRFNPFRADSWQELASAISAETVPPNLPPPDSGRPQPGWTVRRATAPALPRTFTVVLWNERMVRQTAWLAVWGCLAAGIALRMWPWAWRGRMASAWLTACVAAAWLAPTMPALIAGGALAGTVLALLIPAPCLRQIGGRRGQASRVGTAGERRTVPPSTISVERPVVTAIIAGIACWGTHTFAQNLPQEVLPVIPLSQPAGVAGGDRREPLAEADGRVVVPVDSHGRPSERIPLVYPTRALAEYLRTLAGQQAADPEYLLTSTQYDVDVSARNAALVRMQMSVAVADSPPLVRIHIPLRDAHLAGPEACLVDGRPHPVYRHPDGDGVLIELAPRRSTDTQSGDAPAVAPQGDRAPASSPAADAGPASSPVAASQEGSAANSPRPFGPMRLRHVELRLRPSLSTDAAGGSLTFSGPRALQSRLRVRFERPQAGISISGARGAVDLAADGRSAAVDLGGADAVAVRWSEHEPLTRPPAVGSAQCAAVLEVVPGRLEYHCRTTYDLQEGGADFVSWRIPDGAAVRRVSVNSQPAQWTVTRGARSGAVLWIELPAFTTRGFVVEASLTVPVSSVRQTITLPVIHPHSAEPRPGDIEVTRLLRHLVAVTTTADFRLQLPRDVEGVLPAAVVPDEAVTAWSRALGLREPQLAFDATRPEPLRVELEPLTIVRQVRLTQTGRFRRSRLTWEAAATIETTGPGVFQHRLQVDPRLRIDSISVTEDAAERLARWIRDGSDVVLFLSGKTAGPQQLTLTGHLPVTAATPLELPSVSISDSQLADAEVILERDQLVQVTFPDDETGAFAAPSAPRQVTDGLLAVARFNSADHRLPRVQVEPASTNLRLQSLSVLEQRSGSRWDLRTVLRWSDPGVIPARTTLRIPPEIADEAHIDSAGTIARRQRSPDGALLVTLQFEPTTPARWIAAVTVSPVTMPAAGTWTVPEIGIADAAVSDDLHHLLVSPGGLLRPTGTSTVRIANDELDHWPNELLPEDWPDPRWQAFRSRQRPWTMRQLPGAEPESPPRIPLLETLIWPQTGASRQGVTELVLVMPAGVPLRLSWPEGCRLRCALVDGRSVAVSEPANKVLEVPLSQHTSAHSVVLFWEDAEAPPRGVLGSLELAFPYPERPQPERALVTLLTGPGRQHVLRGQGTPADAVQRARVRREGLLDWAELQQQAAGEGGTSSPTEPAEQAQAPGGLVAESLTGSLAATPHRLAAVRWPERSPPSLLRVWFWSDALVTWSLAVPGVMLLSVVSFRLARTDLLERFHAQEGLAWGVLGLVWWSCLAAGALGLGMLAYAAREAFRKGSASVLARRRSPRGPRSL